MHESKIGLGGGSVDGLSSNNVNLDGRTFVLGKMKGSLKAGEIPLIDQVVEKCLNGEPFGWA